VKIDATRFWAAISVISIWVMALSSEPSEAMVFFLASAYTVEVIFCELNRWLRDGWEELYRLARKHGL
jgi:hypothetical protein